MFPPIGFTWGPANMAEPSTWETTWLVTTNATPNWTQQSISIHFLSSSWFLQFKPQYESCMNVLRDCSCALMKYKLHLFQKKYSQRNPFLMIKRAYLICHFLKTSKKLGKMHLPCWQFSSAYKICSIKWCSTIHNHQSKPVNSEIQCMKEHI